MAKQFGDKFGCCKVEAVIGVDERGQMVLPKEVREKADIKPQDKLAVIGVENGGGYCCLVLMRAEKLEETVKNILGPMVKKIIQK